MAAVQERMARTSPFEDHFIDNLKRKLASGALRPEIADQVRAELVRRGYPVGEANSSPHSN
jgi:hypothetical protein